MALVKKKPFDYNDHNYRDAIGRLKLMLADSYSPAKYSSASSIFKSVTDDETDTTENTIIERPIMKDVSKYFSYKPYSTLSNASSYMHQKPVTSQNLQVPSRAKHDFHVELVSNRFVRFQWADTHLTLCFRLATLSRLVNC